MGYHKITPNEAKEMMEQGNNYTLLDVRTPEEFETGCIQGAKLLPDYEIEQQADKELPDKDIDLIVYCRSGVRSKGASLELVSMGYTNVYDMGGIMQWPFAVVAP